MRKIYKVLLSCIFLFLGIPAVFSQTDKELARQYVEIADSAYLKLKAIEVAKEQYIKAVELDSTNIKANFMAGLTYLQTVNKEKASPFLLRAYRIDPNYRFDLLYLIGEALQYGYKFDNAIENYEDYMLKVKTNLDYDGFDLVPLEDARRRMEECENGKILVGHPVKTEIVNMGKEVNSDSYDYAPILSADESKLIFTSRRRDGNINENVDNDNFPFEDIFLSKNIDGKWSKPVNISDSINTLFHDSNLALAGDGKRLYVYKDENGGDIYVSELGSLGLWSTPIPLNDNINTEYSETSVCLSPDGNVMFFASNRPGGYGEFDIYMSVKDDEGDWGIAINLGAAINTPFDEDGPFMDYDRQILYFSSKGRNSMGGFDIFKSQFDKAKRKWLEPVNIGYPINTPDDDVYITISKDGKFGFYASVRDQGLGYHDLYKIKLPE